MEEHRAMATVVSGDVRKPPHEEDSSSDSVSTALDPVAPRHFTLNNIASQIELLDILIVAGVGHALKTGKLLNWIRKPWDLFKRRLENSYTGPENEEDHSVQLAQKKPSRWCPSSHRYSGTPDLKGFKGIGEAYMAETYAGFRQKSFNHSPRSVIR